MKSNHFYYFDYPVDVTDNLYCDPVEYLFVLGLSTDYLLLTSEKSPFFHKYDKVTLDKHSMLSSHTQP